MSRGWIYPIRFFVGFGNVQIILIKPAQIFRINKKSEHRQKQRKKTMVCRWPRCEKPPLIWVWHHLVTVSKACQHWWKGLLAQRHMFPRAQTTWIHFSYVLDSHPGSQLCSQLVRIIWAKSPSSKKLMSWLHSSCYLKLIWWVKVCFVWGFFNISNIKFSGWSWTFEQ